MSSSLSHAANDPFTVPSVTRREESHWFTTIPGERISFRIRGDQVGGRILLIESVAAPGCATPLHRHAEDEVFYVVEGEATFRLGDEIFRVAPGGTVLIPAGTPHAWINATSSEVRLLATFAPAGLEGFFMRISNLPPEELAALALTYGTVVLGPPMQA